MISRTPNVQRLRKLPVFCGRILTITTSALVSIVTLIASALTLAAPFSAHAAFRCDTSFMNSYVKSTAGSSDAPGNRVYRFDKMRSDLLEEINKPDAVDPAKVKCLTDFFDNSMADSGKYWGKRVGESSCTERCQKEYRKSRDYLLNLDREFKDTLKDKLADAAAKAKTSPNPAECAQRAAESPLKAIESTRQTLCCGTEESKDKGAVRGVYPDISYQTCVGKIKPTDQTLVSLSGGADCLVNAARQALMTVFENVKSFFTWPLELWAAKDEIWQIMTNKDAFNAFVTKLASKLKDYVVNRVVSVANCLNSYETAQFACSVGGQIIGNLATPSSIIKILDWIKAGTAAGNKILTGMLSQSEGGRKTLESLSKMQAKADAAVEGLAKAKSGVQKAVISGLAKSSEAVAALEKFVKRESAFQKAWKKEAERKEPTLNEPPQVASARASSETGSTTVADKGPEPIRGESPVGTKGADDIIDAPQAPSQTQASTLASKAKKGDVEDLVERPDGSWGREGSMDVPPQSSSRSLARVKGDESDVDVLLTGEGRSPSRSLSANRNRDPEHDLERNPERNSERKLEDGRERARDNEIASEAELRSVVQRSPRQDLSPSQRQDLIDRHSSTKVVSNSRPALETQRQPLLLEDRRANRAQQDHRSFAETALDSRQRVALVPEPTVARKQSARTSSEPLQLTYDGPSRQSASAKPHDSGSVSAKQEPRLQRAEAVQPRSGPSGLAAPPPAAPPLFPSTSSALTRVDAPRVLPSSRGRESNEVAGAGGGGGGSAGSGRGKPANEARANAPSSRGPNSNPGANTNFLANPSGHIEALNHAERKIIDTARKVQSTNKKDTSQVSRLREDVYAPQLGIKDPNRIAAIDYSPVASAKDLESAIAKALGNESRVDVNQLLQSMSFNPAKGYVSRNDFVNVSKFIDEINARGGVQAIEKMNLTNAERAALNAIFDRAPSYASYVSPDVKPMGRLSQPIARQEFESPNRAVVVQGSKGDVAATEIIRQKDKDGVEFSTVRYDNDQANGNGSGNGNGNGNGKGKSNNQPRYDTVPTSSLMAAERAAQLKAADARLTETAERHRSNSIAEMEKPDYVNPYGVKRADLQPGARIKVKVDTMDGVKEVNAIVQRSGHRGANDFPEIQVMYLDGVHTGRGAKNRGQPVKQVTNVRIADVESVKPAIAPKPSVVTPDEFKPINPQIRKPTNAEMEKADSAVGMIFRRSVDKEAADILLDYRIGERTHIKELERRLTDDDWLLRREADVGRNHAAANASLRGDIADPNFNPKHYFAQRANEYHSAHQPGKRFSENGRSREETELELKGRITYKDGKEVRSGSARDTVRAYARQRNLPAAEVEKLEKWMTDYQATLDRQEQVKKAGAAQTAYEKLKSRLYVALRNDSNENRIPLQKSEFEALSRHLSEMQLTDAKKKPAEIALRKLRCSRPEWVKEIPGVYMGFDLNCR